MRRRKKKLNREFIAMVVANTQLSKRTVEELLRAGWTFKREINKPDIWERWPY